MPWWPSSRCLHHGVVAGLELLRKFRNFVGVLNLTAHREEVTAGGRKGMDLIGLMATPNRVFCGVLWLSLLFLWYPIVLVTIPETAT